MHVDFWTQNLDQGKSVNTTFCSVHRIYLRIGYYAFEALAAKTSYFLYADSTNGSMPQSSLDQPRPSRFRTHDNSIMSVGQNLGIMSVKGHKTSALVQGVFSFAFYKRSKGP
jgi:hypothetical protein